MKAIQRVCMSRQTLLEDRPSSTESVTVRQHPSLVCNIVTDVIRVKTGSLAVLGKPGLATHPQEEN